MRTSAILGGVVVVLIAAGCLAAAYVRQSAVLTHRTVSHAPPKSNPAKGWQFGGATPIAPERWTEGIEFPEIRSVPRIVSVAFDITASGAETHCRVDPPLPQQGFGGEVCAAVERNARFRPRLDAHGKAVSTRGRVRFRFEFKD